MLYVLGWFLVSILSIAYLGDPPFLTLGVACLGGAILGWKVHEMCELSLFASYQPSNETRTYATLLHGLVFITILVNFGLFVFLDQLFKPGFVVLCALFFIRLVHWGKVFPHTPNDLLIGSLWFLTFLSGFWVSDVSSLSHPKIVGLLLSILIYYELTHGMQLGGNHYPWLILLNIAGIGMAVLGFLGTDWFSTKVLNLSSIYASTPQVLTDIPRSIRGGFHANGVAGTLVFVIPLYVTQFICIFRGGSGKHADRSQRVTLFPITVVIAFVCTTIVLILTQSRGAFLGLVLSLIALVLAWRRRWILSLGSPIVLLIIAGVLLLKFSALGRTFDLVDNGGTQKILSSYEFRMTVWRMALKTIHVFPFTGVGIGTFDPVSRALYPFLYPPNFLFVPSATITHAHNELLQVAVDIGIPGLVVYVALLAAFARVIWRVYTWAQDESIRRLVLGIAAGLLAHQIFGLTDAFMLGTKPGIVMWILMGIITGMYLNLAPEHLAKERAGKNNED